MTLKNQLKKTLLIYKRPSVTGLAKQVSIIKTTNTTDSCSDLKKKKKQHQQQKPIIIKEAIAVTTVNYF